MTRFVDQAMVLVQAGRGGKGCRSTYSDLWTRHPIPDGGNGGRGGNVLVRANPQLTTLLDFQTKRHFRAGPGGHGSSKRQNGAQGMEIRIEVPVGTVLWETQSQELIREFLHPGEEVVVARGGAGGIGNGSRGSRTAFHQESLEGSDGEKRALRLELKLFADVGIVGMPNAGKSTLIRQISQARPKVAPFPFTTTSPVLGAVELASGKRIVAVDVPGLIEGAHRGKGLGLTFLRHIERTRLLVHLIDMAGMDGRDPVDDYHVFNTELRAYHPAVAEKAQIVVANKMDSPQASENLARFRRRVKVPVAPISAATGDGVQRLLKRIETVMGKK